MEFPNGSVGKGSSIVAAVVQVWSLAQEYLHAMGAVKNKNQNKNW